MTSREVIAAAVPLLPLLAGLAVAALPSPRAGQRVALLSAALTALRALITSAWALIDSDRPVLGDWLCVDAAGGVLVGVIGTGRRSQPGRLPHVPGDCADQPVRYAAPARPLLHRAARVLGRAAGDTARGEPRRSLAADRGQHRRVGAPRRVLGQATRARGGLEVPRAHLARPGCRAARRAGPAARTASRRAGRSACAYTSIHAAAPGLDHQLALARYLLLLAGLAAKIGWAPVHNWLPDAHSEAPAPVRRCSRLPCSRCPARRLARRAGARRRCGRRQRHTTCSSSSAWRRWPWQCRSCGARWPGSGCSPTPASSTWE